MGSVIRFLDLTFGVAIAARLSPLIGRRFLHDNAPDPALGKFAREVFNEFFPVFRAAVNAEGLEVMSVVEESWNLRITLSNPKTQAQVAIYSDGRGRIKSSNWVGKPPGDHSLVDAFGRALKRI
ncbi:MAG: hypothetical protein IPP28_00365 [Xanthomonadales bacterium]|nr:hypothetical protein [Xanthomonadales bacterium]